MNWSMVTCQGSTRYCNYLEDYWPCAGGLSAVNAIGTQLRDPINSGLTRWRMAVTINEWAPPRKAGGTSTEFSMSNESRQAGAGRDGRTRLAKPNSQARKGTGTCSFSLFS